MELLKTYRRSLAEFTDRVEQVHPGQWSAATPCPGWDVRTLVNHVVSEERWSVPLLAGRTIDEVGDRYDGDQLGTDPIEVAREAAAQAEVAATSPGALERTVHLSAGATPAEEYLHQLLAEHLIHGWDLAVAIGADPTMDADAVAEAARWYSRHVADYRRDGLVEPEVELPAGAGEQDRLLAAFGRNPDWAP
ncbi:MULTISPECIES: TIGR03086 family metal-binding protein [unclassified Micromonospora]|uniref:TIGR03086 family metal-binding protein n=1 Tax=unclassified Micromonospora TaxID=2617518 RepID=UPI0022B5F0A7|nr:MULTISPECIES: TIGR03086 family metal-binding protein [unclassified Micromonospora]MCZ7420108.1 TIGR03086 family metal-binding protein [Verrucosispora sp. WMMA2121]WBB89371.1 TIGR03086 family metal-binding protein [Verrucosispora sp. WMMC514]